MTILRRPSNKVFLCILLTCSIFLTSCYVPRSASYKALYAHLNCQPRPNSCTVETDYFVVLMVEARHLDYTNNECFLKTMVKHPSDGSKNRDVGHAWIYLQGIVDGESIYLEGGHSGERGVVQARYFEGIMNYLEYGYASPTRDQYNGIGCRWEPNPVKYLWEVQRDGYFQQGPGRHRPTYAIKIDLSPEQFERILAFINNYPFCDYQMTGQQCSSFLAQVACLAGLELECEVSMPVDPVLNFHGEKIRLWEDPAYSILTIASPDILERSMMKAVRDGKADYAMDWCKRRYTKN